MFLWRLILLLLVLCADNFVVGRKVKRKDPYGLSAPPLPQHYAGHDNNHNHGHGQGQVQVHESDGAPYHFEEIHRDEFGAPPAPPPPSLSSSSSSQNHQQQQHHHPHNHQHPEQISSRYETDYVTLQHSSGAGKSSGATFLIDNGLRNIAKGSADQANSAVASQNAAGKQAAYVAKSTLAQAASQAAGTALAALKGKEVLLHRLEEQNVDAHKAMESELLQLQQAKRAAKTAQYSAQQAINHVSVLTAALNNAQSASSLAQASASEAAAELASQIDMVSTAKSKLEQVEAHLYNARIDYEETKEAAEKAQLSAQEAHLNANDAALHANVELSDSILVHDKSDQQLHKK